jgi:hypothetical protein
MPGARQQIDITAQPSAEDLCGTFWTVGVFIGAPQPRGRGCELQPGQIENPKGKPVMASHENCDGPGGLTSSTRLAGGSSQPAAR